MTKPLATSPIGVFDSGLGGISVLKELRALLPGEDYVFFGDRANAPYGDLSPERVVELTEQALSLFLEKGCKAMVLACNTATATAADAIREKYPDLPIVGIEPALKPAVRDNPGKKILLLATPLAVKTPRITSLAQRFEDQAEITLFPCPRLVEMVEFGHLHDETLFSYLKELFSPLTAAPDALVLGCTHYPHIAPALQAFFGPHTRLYDGGPGTARRMKAILEERGLLSQNASPGKIELIFSSGGAEILALAETLLNA